MSGRSQVKTINPHTFASVNLLSTRLFLKSLYNCKSDSGCIMLFESNETFIK